jgi:hypothetical protein
MGVFNDSLAAPVTEDRVAAVRITAYRGVHCNLRDDSGNEMGTAASPLRVDPTGATLQPISGTVTITDGGGSITVDGTIAATQSGSWSVDAVQSGSWSVSITGSVTVADLATADYDTGAGTVTQAMIGFALPASGGPVAGGTTTNPIRTDPTGTTAQPVTDNGGSLTVDDGGGSLTVDGTVAATQSGTWSVRLTDGTDTVDVFDLANANPLAVAIVDSSGNQITSFGGGTPQTDDASFTAGSGTGNVMFGFADETSTDNVDEGDAGAVRMSLDRILYVRGNSFISTNNSTTATLTLGSTFTGTGDEVTHCAAITVNIRASHAAATDGVSLEWSNDNTNWDRTEKWDYPVADRPMSVTVRPKGRYFRLVYTNGGTNQTTFRVQTIMHAVSVRTEPYLDSGRVMVDGVSYKVKSAAINATASGDNTVIAAVSGKRFRVLTIVFTCSGAVDITFKSASTTLINAMSFAKQGGLGANVLPAGFVPEGGVNENWIMSLSGAANVRGWLTYIEII